VVDDEGIRLTDEQRLDWLLINVDFIGLFSRLSRSCRV
jgi:hypothetical protein